MTTLYYATKTVRGIEYITIIGEYADTLRTLTGKSYVTVEQVKALQTLGFEVKHTSEQTELLFA